MSSPHILSLRLCLLRWIFLFALRSSFLRALLSREVTTPSARASLLSCLICLCCLSNRLVSRWVRFPFLAPCSMRFSWILDLAACAFVAVDMASIKTNAVKNLTAFIMFILLIKMVKMTCFVIRRRRDKKV